MEGTKTTSAPVVVVVPTTTTTLRVASESWPIAGSFRISRGSKTEAHIVVVTLQRCGQKGEVVVGRGECVPYNRYGETVEGVIAAIEGLRAGLEAGRGRAWVNETMGAGAARNAVDCALWDLECKEAGRRIWEMEEVRSVLLSGRRRSIVNVCKEENCVEACDDDTGQEGKGKVTTAVTLSIDAPLAMEEAARRRIAEGAAVLKLKLAGDEHDAPRVRAVRRAAPAATLIVDANEGCRDENLEQLINDMAEAGVSIIEQPLPAEADGALTRVAALASAHRVHLCADESMHDSSTLSSSSLSSRYSMINLKLDKTGGLTEALQVLRLARREGMAVMVGCMVATSLAMAPAMLLAAHADAVDLDGPLLLARDREAGLVYRGGGAEVDMPRRELWG